MFGKSIDLTDEEFELIRDFIYEKTGMFFKKSKKYLIRSRLISRLKELHVKSFKDYYYKTKFDKKELIEMVNRLTTNETSFFRNSNHMRELRENIIKEIARNKNQIRVWSAGCSTGEEPYSIAMIIKDLNKKGKNINAEIVGTDIDENALKKARDGIYRNNSFRSSSLNRIKKEYFKKKSKKCELKSEIKKMVQYSKVNLVDNFKMSMMKNFDIVLCRNVLIYFGMEARKKVLQNFYKSLNKGGYFILGHSETLHGIFDGFSAKHVKGAVIYKKE